MGQSWGKMRVQRGRWLGDEILDGENGAASCWRTCMKSTLSHTHQLNRNWGGGSEHSFDKLWYTDHRTTRAGESLHQIGKILCDRGLLSCSPAASISPLPSLASLPRRFSPGQGLRGIFPVPLLGLAGETTSVCWESYLKERGRGGGGGLVSGVLERKET